MEEFHFGKKHFFRSVLKKYGDLRLQYRFVEQINVGVNNLLLTIEKYNREETNTLTPPETMLKNMIKAVSRS